MKLYHKKLSHIGDFWFGEYEVNQTVQMSLNYALALGIHYMYTHTVQCIIIGFTQYMLH